MKSFLLVVAVVVSTSAADDFPSTLSFTNKQGLAIQNAQVVRVRTNDVIFRLPGDSGGIGAVKLGDLPLDLARKFGYDPELLKKREAEAEERAAQDAPLNAAAAQINRERQQIQLLRANAFSGRMYIEGVVLQKLEQGLLIRSGTEIRARAEAQNRRNGIPSGGEVAIRGVRNGIIVYDDLCLLTDFRAAGSLVDNDKIAVIAFPNGEYSYTTTSGGKKTVRTFTTDLTKVTSVSSPSATAAAKAMRPY